MSFVILSTPLLNSFADLKFFRDYTKISVKYPMQIRELTLKELDTAWELVKLLRTSLDYDTFEDLIYEMQDAKYTMIGIFENSELVAYAGVKITTNLYDKRHLCVQEFIVKPSAIEEKYKNFLDEYLKDYANIGACEKVVFSENCC